MKLMAFALSLLLASVPALAETNPGSSERAAQPAVAKPALPSKPSAPAVAPVKPSLPESAAAPAPTKPGFMDKALEAFGWKTTDPQKPSAAVTTLPETAKTVATPTQTPNTTKESLVDKAAAVLKGEKKDAPASPEDIARKITERSAGDAATRRLEIEKKLNSAP